MATILEKFGKLDFWAEEMELTTHYFCIFTLDYVQVRVQSFQNKTTLLNIDPKKTQHSNSCQTKKFKFEFTISDKKLFYKKIQAW